MERVLEDVLRHDVNYVNPDQTDWDQYLSVTLFLAGHENYESDCLSDVRTIRGKRRDFLVKWQWLGYGPEHNTWEPELIFLGCSDMLQVFWDSQAPKLPERAAA